jgi:hypothetical protein
VSEVGLLKTSSTPEVSETRKRLFYEKIHKVLVSGNLLDNDTLDEVRDGYECTALSSGSFDCLLTSQVHENVPIDALCLFDTVAALGVPKVGAGAYIAPILRILPPFRQDYAHLENLVNCPPESKLHAISSNYAIVSYLFLYRCPICFSGHVHSRNTSDIS